MFGKTSGLSTVAIAIVAVVVIAGIGGAIFFVLPSLSSDAPTQASVPSAPSQPSTPSAPNQPSTPTAPSEPPTQPEAMAQVRGNTETCEGFVTQEEAESALGTSLIWVFEPPRESAARDRNLAQICTGTYVSETGNLGLGVVIMTMVSEGQAFNRIQAVLGNFEEQGLELFGEILPTTLAEESAIVIINADGVGSTVMARSGIYLVILTEVDVGETDPISDNDLVDLITEAVKRLPN